MLLGLFSCTWLWKLVKEEWRLGCFSSQCTWQHFRLLLCPQDWLCNSFWIVPWRGGCTFWKGSEKIKKVSKCNKPLVGLRGSQSRVERPNWCQENLSLVLRDPTDVKKQLCLQASAACLFHHSAQIYPAEDMRFSWRSDRVSSWASPNLRERRGRAS